MHWTFFDNMVTLPDKRVLNCLSGLILVLTSWSSVYAADPAANFSNALRKSVLDNPRISTEWYRLEAAIAAERAARGAMLPTVNDGGFGDTSGDDPFDLSDPFETPEQPSEVLVYYSFDSAEIPMDFDAELEMLAMRLSDDPDAKALIEGHADDSGARNYNNTLSLERAEAIKLRLVQQYAVNPDQIELIEYGEDRPQKTLPEEQPQNRRAVILIE